MPFPRGVNKNKSPFLKFQERAFGLSLDFRLLIDFRKSYVLCPYILCPEFSL